MAYKLEVCICGKERDYYAEILCHGTVNPLDTPEIICKKAVEEALRTQNYRKFLCGVEAESDEVLFCVLDYIYSKVTLPLIEENRDYAFDFSAEYPKIITRKSADFRRKAQMMKFLVNYKQKTNGDKDTEGEGVKINAG